MTKNTKDIIEAAISGGVIGAALGALITGKGEKAFISAIVGAAISASIKAAEEAKKTNIPVLYAVDGKIYRYHPDGRIEYVRDIKRDKKTVEIPKTFKIE